MTLQVNTENLRSLSTNLARVRRTLESAYRDTQQLRSAIPHERLVSTLEDFSGKWERRRAELTEQVDVLQQKAKVAADAFADVDDELADAIEGE